MKYVIVTIVFAFGLYLFAPIQVTQTNAVADHGGTDWVRIGDVKYFEHDGYRCYFHKWGYGGGMGCVELKTE